MKDPETGIELKPCPFCGGDTKRYVRTETIASKFTAYCVTCVKCSARGPLKNTYEQAVTAWNERVVGSVCFLIGSVQSIIQKLFWR